MFPFTGIPLVFCGDFNKKCWDNLKLATKIVFLVLWKGSYTDFLQFQPQIGYIESFKSLKFGC